MSLRRVIEDYIIKHPEEALEIEKEISIEYEITALAYLVENKAPLLLFKKIKDYQDFNIVSNVFSTKERIFSYFGYKNEEDFYNFWSYLNSVNLEYKIVKSKEAPVKEKIYTYSEVNLFSLPVPLHYPQDGGRYITSGIIVARDPENPKTVNLSFARMQLVSKNEIALSMHSRGHLWTYYLKAKKLEKDLPFSVIIGAHPLYYLLAASRIENEYSKVNGIIDDYLILGETNDIPVPANSEIVLEGKILWDRSYPEGPFTEYTGYLSNRSTNNFAIIDAMYMRKNPLYLEINPSNSKEHITLSSISKEPLIISTIRNFFQTFSTYKLEWPLKGVHYVLFGKIMNSAPGEAMQLALLSLGLDHYLKVVFMVEGDEELKLFNVLSSLLCWNKITVLEDVLCNKLDPSSNADGTSSKVIFIGKSLEKFKIKEKNEGIEIYRCGKKLNIGREIDNKAYINVLVGQDIDPSNEDEVLWALATRFQPKDDLIIEKDKITVRLDKRNFSAPKLPKEVLEKVKGLILPSRISF